MHRTLTRLTTPRPYYHSHASEAFNRQSGLCSRLRLGASLSPAVFEHGLATFAKQNPDTNCDPSFHIPVVDFSAFKGSNVPAAEKQHTANDIVRAFKKACFPLLG